MEIMKKEWIYSGEFIVEKSLVWFKNGNMMRLVVNCRTEGEAKKACRDFNNILNQKNGRN